MKQSPQPLLDSFFRELTELFDKYQNDHGFHFEISAQHSFVADAPSTGPDGLSYDCQHRGPQSKVQFTVTNMSDRIELCKARYTVWFPPTNES